MNFFFILPIKVAISHQVLSLERPLPLPLGNLINLAAVEKTKRQYIIELQYCTCMSRREIQKKKNNNKKNLWPYYKDVLLISRFTQQNPLLQKYLSRRHWVLEVSHDDRVQEASFLNIG